LSWSSFSFSSRRSTVLPASLAAWALTQSGSSSSTAAAAASASATAVPWLLAALARSQVIAPHSNDIDLPVPVGDSKIPRPPAL
jgi:hypothetical protein